LKKGFWAPGLTSKVWLFTMRCVLPHIENPFHFLDSMAQEHPNAMVLIEFQSLDWLLRNGVWYQLCHDHVNQFRIIDFARRFSLISSGSFANGEWEWVLIRLAKSTSKLNQESQDDSLELKSRFKSLKEKRQEFLDAVTDWQKPILIWGAAGKGINLADFLARYTSTQINITDMDFHRWQLYLEGSGYLVLNPEIALLSLPSDGVIFVSNPNHLEVVRNFAKEHKLVFPACEVSFVF
jgi:hypothetical protein